MTVQPRARALLLLSLLVLPGLAFAQARAPSGGGSSGTSSGLSPPSDLGGSLGTASLRWLSLYGATLKDGNSVNRLIFGSGQGNVFLGAAPDGASAIGSLFNTSTTYSTSGAKIASFQNGGAEKVFFTKDGAANFAGKVDVTGARDVVGIGGAFSAPYGIFFPTGDNTIYYQTGSVSGGSHSFADSGHSTWVRMAAEGIHLGESQPVFTVFYQYTDSSGTPGAATINRPLGRSAIAMGASSVVVTNSLANATSQVDITPEDLDATLTAWKVTYASGSFTVTGNAVSTAVWKFRWKLSRGE